MQSRIESISSDLRFSVDRFFVLVSDTNFSLLLFGICCCCLCVVVVVVWLFEVVFCSLLCSVVVGRVLLREIQVREAAEVCGMFKKNLHRKKKLQRKQCRSSGVGDMMKECKDLK